MHAAANAGHEDLVSVEHQLCNIVVALGACRKQLGRLCDNQTALEHRCLAAEQGYAQCAQAYQHLFDQHQRTTKDLTATAGRCRSLKKEAESAQTAMLALRSTGWRSGGCDDTGAAPVKQEAECTAGSSCAHLHADVVSLKKERAGLREALAGAADVICTLNQKIDSLQTEREAEQQQAATFERASADGDRRKEILPVRDASSKRILRSHVRDSC